MDHSKVRVKERSPHDESPKYWCPKYQDWLSLEEIAFKKTQESNQCMTNSQTNEPSA
jgi:hypothetical protein